MLVEAIPTCGEARAGDLQGKTAIIIDVLRATSNMVTALENGCASVLPVETVDQAEAAAAAGDLLGGERGCQRIPGFDLGNSPLEYTAGAVYGKRIVMTTTNGTRAVYQAGKASLVLIGSLLNATACAKAAFQAGRDVTLICAGTQDVFALEDGLCAGMIVDRLTGLARAAGSNILLGDFAMAMKELATVCEDRLEQMLAACANGRRLARLGFADDIALCARLDVSRVVPTLNRGELLRSELVCRR